VQLAGAQRFERACISSIQVRERVQGRILHTRMRTCPCSSLARARTPCALHTRPASAANHFKSKPYDNGHAATPGRKMMRVPKPCACTCTHRDTIPPCSCAASITRPFFLCVRATYPRTWPPPMTCMKPGTCSAAPWASIAVCLLQPGLDLPVKMPCPHDGCPAGLVLCTRTRTHCTHCTHPHCTFVCAAPALLIACQCGNAGQRSHNGRQAAEPGLHTQKFSVCVCVRAKPILLDGRLRPRQGWLSPCPCA